MNNNDLFVIGVMSGTSLDGVDIVYSRFKSNDYQDFEILNAQTYPYESYWKNELKTSINYNSKKLKRLDEDYGVYLGNLIRDFIIVNKIDHVNLIASHGHTVFHQPQKGLTLQIGNGQKIANINHCKVICDFRTQDVEFGGQGAPLVPIGDRLLFGSYDACVNLGGFANISYEENEHRIAFDICPVNVVLNHWSEKLGFEYDKGGNFALSGSLNSEVLKQLNQLKYYQISPPKSLGVEWVHANVVPIVNQIISPQEVLRTFVEHIAIQIACKVEKFESVLFTGGGVYNDFLMNRIRMHSNTDLVIPNQDIIDYKEALIFALLGLLRNQNKINCLSSVTGAKFDHSSGKIFSPINS